MAEFFALLFIFIFGTIGISLAINFFWRTGLTKALTYAAFFIFVIIIFWASGLWQNTSRYSWGILTPIFVLIMFGAWIGIKFGRKIILKLQEKLKNSNWFNT